MLLIYLYLPLADGGFFICSILQKAIALIMFIKSGIVLTGLMWFENIQDIIFAMLNYLIKCMNSMITTKDKKIF